MISRDYLTKTYGHGTMMGVFSLAISSGIFLGSLEGGLVMHFRGLNWSVVIGLTVLFLSLAASTMIRSGRSN